MIFRSVASKALAVICVVSQTSWRCWHRNSADKVSRERRGHVVKRIRHVLVVHSLAACTNMCVMGQWCIREDTILGLVRLT